MYAIIIFRFRATKFKGKAPNITIEHFEDTAFLYCRSNPEEFAYALEAFAEWSKQKHYSDVQIISIETKDDVKCHYQEEEDGPFSEIGISTDRNWNRSYPEQKIIVATDLVEEELLEYRENGWEIYDICQLTLGHFIPLSFSPTYEKMVEDLAF